MSAPSMWRRHTAAGDTRSRVLDFVCRDLRDMGIATLYLLTDHTSFYEHCGWKFLCMVQGDREEEMSRMYVKESGAGDGTSLNEKTPEEKKNGVK